MFGMFKKTPAEEELLEYETFVDYTSTFPSIDQKELTYSEQLTVLMYQLDRIEDKIDQLSINRDENET